MKRSFLKRYVVIDDAGINQFTSSFVVGASGACSCETPCKHVLEQSFRRAALRTLKLRLMQADGAKS